MEKSLLTPVSFCFRPHRTACGILQLTHTALALEAQILNTVFPGKSLLTPVLEQRGEEKPLESGDNVTHGTIQRTAK